MYESYWGLSAKPFRCGSSIDRRFRSQSQNAALLRLNYGFDNAVEAAVIVGGSGLGKSTVLKLLQQEQPQQRTVVQVLFPSLLPVELLRVVAAELRLARAEQLPADDAADDEVTATSLETATADSLLFSIRGDLRRLAAAERQTLVCFDDAHLLSAEAIVQAVQPLLNLAGSDSKLRCTVVLAGQPVLISRLARQSQLNERVGVVATLQGFSCEEATRFVTAQLTAAGCKQAIFSDSALQALYELSQGNPRRLQRLCDMALLVGCAERLAEVSEREVTAVAQELLPAAA